MWESIREFGLEYHTLPVMLRNVAILLENLALNVDPRNKKPVFILSYIWLVVMIACYYYVYLVSMVWFVFVRCRETGDLLAGIIVFSLGITSQISIIKVLCLFSYQGSLRKLFGDFLACDSLILPNSRFANFVKKSMRAAKKKAMILWVSIMWNGAVYVIKPLFMLERQHMEENFEFFGFKDMAQMKTSPYYEIVFVVNTIAVYGACYMAATISSLFIIMNGYIEAQVLALSHELNDLWQDAAEQRNCHYYLAKETSNRFIGNSDDTEFFENDQSNKFDVTKKDTKQMTEVNTQDALNRYIKNCLENIVKFHSINISLVYQIEHIFKISIAFEFIILCTGLITCLLGSLEKTFIELPFALMLVSVDCLTGQRIIDASTVFENAVYHSKWENFDVANRKIILLMLRNSQKGMKLSTGGVATLSRECLMNVLKTTYTAYTAIKSTMSH